MLAIALNMSLALTLALALALALTLALTLSRSPNPNPNAGYPTVHTLRCGPSTLRAAPPTPHRGGSISRRA